MEADEARKRGRPRNLTEAERRGRVLDAAEHLILHAGYDAVTMDLCAQEAGMSKRTVYQVFASKMDLFRALLSDRFLALAEPPGEQDGPIAEQLASTLQLLASTCLDARHIALMRVMIGEAGLTGDMATALDELGLGRGAGILERCLSAAVARGALPRIDVNEAANFLFFAALGQALLGNLLGLPAPPCPAQVRMRIHRAVQAFAFEVSAVPSR